MCFDYVAVENDLKQRCIKTVSERSVAEQPNCKRTGKRVEYYVRGCVIIEGCSGPAIGSTHGAALREWKLACPKGPLDLAFPSGKGNVEFHVNLIQRALWPVQMAAGVTRPVLDDQGAPQRDTEGNPMVEPKYPGLHALRHFYASWCINRKQDGGLELPPKSVQQRMGHSSIMVTMDTYGHLFPRSDDTAELAAAEAALLS